MNSGTGKLVVRFVIAAFVVFLWSAPNLGSLFTERNLCCAMWERYDLFWHLAPILIYALLAVLAGLAVDWSGSSGARRLSGALFIFLLGGGVLTSLVHQLSKLRSYQSPLLEVATHFGWMALAMVVACTLLREQSRLVKAARNLCLICSPSMALVVIQLLQAPVYPQRMDPLPDTPARQQVSNFRTVSHRPDSVLPEAPSQLKPAVYWFIFDEWSYPRTYQDRRLKPYFKHLAEFSGQATVFHNARSQGTKTEVSIPAMLYGTRNVPGFEKGRMGFQVDGGFVPVDQFRSVLALPGEHGHFRALAGFGQPYAQWIGQDLELCRSHCFTNNLRGLSKSLTHHASQTASFSADPLMKYLYRKWLLGAPYMPFYRQLHVDLRKDTEWLLTQSPRQTFAIIHYLLPHKPYLFDREGNERPLSPDMTRDTVEAYEDHLACLDLRIGEFLGLLRSNGRFDDALIILTSDHAWRADPLRRTGENPANHVPLIVKLPGQTEARAVDEEFQMYRIGELINSCLGGSAAPTQVARLLSR